MEDALASCRKIIDFSTQEEIDIYAEKQLKAAFLEHKNTKKVALATVRYVVNGKKMTSLLDAILEFEELKTLELHFFRPRMNENWDYNVPTKKLVLLGHGLGGVQVFDYDPYKLDKWSGGQTMKNEKVMIRSFISKYYYPRSIKSKSADIHSETKRLYVPNLMTLEKQWEEIRKLGVVPFQLHISAYTPTNRYNYELDLVGNRIFKDFRGGTVPLKGKASRESLDYFNFDKILATTDMRDLVKRAFITLFDVNELTAFDIAHSFGITDTMAKNSLDAIVSRGLAEKDGHPPREIYMINSENLKTGENSPNDFF